MRVAPGGGKCDPSGEASRHAHAAGENANTPSSLPANPAAPAATPVPDPDPDPDPDPEDPVGATAPP